MYITPTLPGNQAIFSTRNIMLNCVLNRHRFGAAIHYLQNPDERRNTYDINGTLYQNIMQNNRQPTNILSIHKHQQSALMFEFRNINGPQWWTYSHELLNHSSMHASAEAVAILLKSIFWIIRCYASDKLIYRLIRNKWGITKH